MKTKHFALFLISILLLLASGCGGGGGGTLPTCAPDQMGLVTLVSPPFWAQVSSLTPTLSWNYPVSGEGYDYPGPYYYGAVNCVPEKYRVTLRTGPYFADDVGGITSGNGTSWTPSSPLVAGKEYAWGIEPMVGSSVGPFAGYSYFFVGPACTPSALVAPDLLEPANGAELTNNWPDLVWDYAHGCLPDTYNIWFSENADFAEPTINGYTGFQATSWDPPYALEDCHTYYWKVAAIANGSVFGPESPTYSFSINMNGTCLSALPWPEFHAKLAAACLGGPGPSYRLMDTLETGQVFRIVARGVTPGWLILQLDQTRQCWVLSQNGNVEGSLDGLPTLEAPSTFSCTNFGDEASCINNSACIWVAGVYGQGGSCVNR